MTNETNPSSDAEAENVIKTEEDYYRETLIILELYRAISIDMLKLKLNVTHGMAKRLCNRTLAEHKTFQHKGLYCRTVLIPNASQ
ncbi:hypothetical protein [Listeria booriae]|uniref:hypothetical protein n=1 Tax=Listeria booriae TaxID=1552123 RepID=UPI0016278222|nr:hypothetical protein [Listeria booriae]MBC2196287.1 hypothetical protein [Listeria booriae]